MSVLYKARVPNGLLAPRDLTRDLRDLARIAGVDDGLDDLLRRGLDWLSRLAPYDLATIFALEGDTLVVRMARGSLAGPELRGHALSLDRFPSIREALETRRARAFTELDHAHGDGDPFDGVLDLPHGHACMVVPLVAGERAFGVLSLDRARCETYPQGVVDLAEVYGQILALAIANAEQRALLARLHQRDHERAALLEAELRGADEGVLETSRSPAVREVARRARQVAATGTPVLILGETGTGKERLARAVHTWSPRAEQPFVTLNCAAIPAGLLESELFGHVKGAFTGAGRDRAGRFAMANGGTLLLDEIGELPVELQAKLLRVLQEGEFEPVGADRPVKVDVRILAATHVDLRRAIAAGRFREDLYYRLDVFPLSLPPLRERLEDLPLLCASLLQQSGKRTGRAPTRVSDAALEKLAGYEWPGNLRELANVLERATILTDARVLGAETIDLPARGGAVPALPAPRDPRTGLGSLDDAQRAHIARVLAATEGRIYGPGGAAEILGLPPSTLQSRMKKLGLPRVAEKPGAQPR
jgi:transcriptional regulator with GAF, ATPase, and Fis domain